MIDSTKHVAIYSSPRVGSSWFQESLRQHYSMFELFNTDVLYEFTEKRIIPIGSNTRDSNTWYQGDDAVIGERIQHFNRFEKSGMMLSFKPGIKS